jgi:2-isopropylmalate synthase
MWAGAANRMVLGKHSGRNAFKTRMTELGVEFRSEEELNQTFARFKSLADKKHEIFDEDLQALISEMSFEAEEEPVKLVALKVCSEMGETPNATVTITVDGNQK